MPCFSKQNPPAQSPDSIVDADLAGRSLPAEQLALLMAPNDADWLKYHISFCGGPSIKRL
jgi:hypothetical protein